MTNIQKLVDIANQEARDMCKGDPKWLAVHGNNPYTIVNGDWYWKGEKLSKEQATIRTSVYGMLLAQQILAESVA